MNQPSSSSISREAAVTIIATLRKEWELEANNESLICIRASIGFLLADIVVGLELTVPEQRAALGVELFRELEVAGVLTTGHDTPALPEKSLEWVPENWVLSEQTQKQ